MCLRVDRLIRKLRSQMSQKKPLAKVGDNISSEDSLQAVTSLFVVRSYNLLTDRRLISIVHRSHYSLLDGTSLNPGLVSIKA